MNSTLSIRSKTDEQPFGTFFGVFLPAVLPLLGVVLFLRLGSILYFGGLVATYLVISLAAIIMITTAFSMSSMATNMRIGNGGVYYVLSRTFGVEIGGAIGMALYLAQSFGIAFYIMGFTESILPFFPFLDPKLIALSVLGILAFLAWFSSRLLIKIGFVILVLVAVALFSVFSGIQSVVHETSHTLKMPFWGLFALFFPAMTGIEAGLSFSSELKNPQKSIPLGIIGASILAYLVYVVTTYYIFRYTPEKNLHTSFALANISYVPKLVYIGMWFATLSGALSTLLSAPRMLQALAKDKGIPKFFASLRVATLFTVGLTACAFSIGGIDKLAPILTMFFLAAYGMLNLTTGIEALIGNPSFRPTLKVASGVSIAAACVCFMVMLTIDPSIAFLSFFGIFLLYLFMKKRQIQSSWDDTRHSILLFLSRFAVFGMVNTKPSGKSWRPNLLVFIGDPLLRTHLLEFTEEITHKKGFLTMATILPGFSKEAVKKYKDGLLSFFREKNVPAIVEVKASSGIMEGMKKYVSYYGLGPISPNTIVLGATQKKEKYPIFSEMINLAYQKEKNVVIIKEKKEHIHNNKKKRIDVWWGGKNRHNSELMLVLSYMLQTSSSWKGSQVHLKTVVRTEVEYAKMSKELQSFAEYGRMHIYPEVVMAEQSDKGADKDFDIFKDVIYPSSKEADLVFLGLKKPDGDLLDYTVYYQNLLEKTKDFSAVSFVLAGEDIAFYKTLS